MTLENNSNDFLLAPIDIQFKSLKTTPLGWTPKSMIIYILSGTVTVNVNENHFRLKEDDLILINAYDLHALTSSGCKCAYFTFDLTQIKGEGILGVDYYFDCNSATIKSHEALIPIKHLLARLIKTSQETESGNQLMLYAHTYELLHHLVRKYQVQSQNEQAGNRKRLANMLSYINVNYKKNITLKEVAKHMYLTSPYLSKIFKDSMGTTFRSYINGLRLGSAISDLRNLDWTIDFVAEQNGFANARSFVQVFKEKYGMLPSDYRNNIKKEGLSGMPPTSTRGQMGIVHKKHLGKLATYLEESYPLPTTENETVAYSELTPTNCSLTGHKLKHTFKKMTTIGMARHLLLANFQNMLRILQKDVGFEYVKFHGLLDDEMMVYSENHLEEAQLNFTYIDIVFDFLLSINLKPIMQLSYMPKDLAKDPSKTINFLESHISLPKDYNKWTYLIKQLVIHLQNRYGADEIRRWPFYLWNTPDAPELISGIKNQADYFHFYKITYEAVKQIDPNIIFGSPALMNGTIEEGTWVTDFIKYCKANHCMPAFINYHFYPVILKSTLSSNDLTASNLVLDRDENCFKTSINKIKRNARQYDWQVDRFYISEWNSSISHRELLNDTAFKPPYIIKNILENYDRMESFAFWSLTDFIEEVQMSGNLFHGGVGLFTYNGVKKAQYYAFNMLARLGDSLLGNGEGYFITKKGTAIQVILYNYQHYSSLYASGELFDMTFEDRYTPFPNLHKHKYILPLTDLESSHYIITDTILNREHGSAFDKWVELGAMPLETELEIEYLKSVSVPKITKQRTAINHNELLIIRTLEPHEVRFIEIKPEVMV